MKHFVLLTYLAVFPLVVPGPARGADTGRSVKVVPTTGVLAGTEVYGNSHALLIGINQYPNLRPENALHFAVKDAEDLRDVLVAQYGFSERNITLLTDAQATRRAIEETLASFADPGKVGPNDRIIVYFSGHGQTVKLPTGGDMGFLLPYDAKVDLSNADNASPYLVSCLRMDTIWGYLESSPAKHALLLADACYSGILAGERGADERISPEALKALVSRRAMQIMTAGRKGEESLENDRLGHGAFTYTLLEQLRQRARVPGDVFTVQDLFATLQRGVGNVTQGRQNPRLAARNTEGEFVFITAGGTPPAPVAPQPGPGEEPPPAPIIGTVQTTATLAITTQPPGATVYLNENEQQPEPTPCSIVVPLGRFKEKQIEVAVEKQGYRSAVHAVTLVRGQTAKLALTLSPLAAAPVTPPVPQPAANVSPNPPAEPVVPAPAPTRPQPVTPAPAAAPARDEMVLIPEGVFTMGIKTRQGELKPHVLMLPAYYIDKYEVTSAQYARFLNEAGGDLQDAYGHSFATANEALPLERVDGQWRPKEGLANHPVVNVTWYGAAAYARWAKKRLPTEAEWEKAARGTEAFRYPWGNDWDPKRCNWDESGASDGFDSTAPVGSFPAGASPYGCMDMSGNVWEWTNSIEKPYPYRADDGREDLDASDYRVMRGGSWRIDDPEFMTACVRLSNLPTYFNNRTGFRCARSAE